MLTEFKFILTFTVVALSGTAFSDNDDLSMPKNGFSFEHVQDRSYKNPVLQAMHELHPLGDRYAKRVGDINGNGSLETVRLDSRRNLIVVENYQGNVIGSITLKGPIDGFGIDDVDRDGFGEIHVLSHGQRKIRAYDLYGIQLGQHNEQLSRLSKDLYASTVDRTLAHLYTQPVSDGGVSSGGYFPPPLDPDSEDLACQAYLDDPNANVVVWDGVTVDSYGRRVIDASASSNVDAVIGTQTSDLIIGGNFLVLDAVICGRGGDDWIYATKHSFYTFGELVTAFGGSGNDIIIGTEDQYGGSGHDTLIGYTAYSSEMYGEGGDDFLVGRRAGDHTIYSGGAGDDVVNDSAYSTADAHDDGGFNVAYEMGPWGYDDDVCYTEQGSILANGLSDCESVIILDPYETVNLCV